jgi:hypothetical protein
MMRLSNHFISHPTHVTYEDPQKTKIKTHTLKCIIIESQADSVVTYSNSLRPVFQKQRLCIHLFNIVVHVSLKKNRPNPFCLTVTESVRVFMIMYFFSYLRERVFQIERGFYPKTQRKNEIRMRCTEAVP